MNTEDYNGFRYCPIRAFSSFEVQEEIKNFTKEEIKKCWLAFQVSYKLGFVAIEQIKKARQ